MAAFHAHGAPARAVLGNSLTEQSCFNARLQGVGMRVGEGDIPGCAALAADRIGISMDFGTSANNGNVRSQTVARGGAGAFSVAFRYDAMGQLAAEYTTGAPAKTGTDYLTVDHLGSTRLVTNASGTVVSQHDFLPFGEEINAGVGGRTTSMGYAHDPYAAIDPTQRFTGKERDAETGLDYFGARFFSGAQRRFTGPDAPFADQHADDPRSWNLYGYVRNNPLQYVDPDGREAASFPLFNGKTLVPRPEQTKPLSPRQQQFGRGLIQIGVGIGVLASTATGNPTGPAGAVLAANGILTASAALALGTANTVGAAANQDVSRATEVLTATGNLGGLAATAATGGDLQAGQAAATVTSAVALAQAPQAAGANPGTAADALNTVSNTITLGSTLVDSVTSAIRGLVAPATPTPQPRQPLLSVPPCTREECQ